MNLIYQKQVDIAKTREELECWIQAWFENNAGSLTKAVVGISGGKDSCIVAKLLVNALGKDRVLGVLMPNGKQSDINVSKEIVKWLDIESLEVNVRAASEAILHSLEDAGVKEIRQEAIINTPARIRMTTLYAIAACLPYGGRVANTCNLSEDFVGYATKFGDGAGDFSPLSNLTVKEVKALGYELGIPAEFIEKTPTDGLCGLTDEENLGFTYEVLDQYIRKEKGWETIPQEIRNKIERFREMGAHKLEPMPSFLPKSWRK